MRVLIDIVHPADVLFFRRPMLEFRALGYEQFVASRKKDVTCELLDEFGIVHHPLSAAGEGVFGLGLELVRRSTGMIRAARQFRPDVMLGFGGVAISHVGALLNIPSLAFYDTENATLQAKLTWPFISHLYVPKSYLAPVPEGRTTRLAGVKELSYLHPEHFTPSRQTAIDAGLDPNCENFLIRLVAWRANHDLGKSGWDEAMLRTIIGSLPGRVHISSEVALPSDLEPLRYRGKFSAIHHLMAYCRLFVGESASMAAEAGVLGVPSIYSAEFRLGYIDELADAGLLRQVATAETLSAIYQALAQGPEHTIADRDRYIAQSADWGEAVIEAARSHVR
jgi:predicted glycosyltransferase